MVAAMVTELEFVSPPAQCQTDELMAQTDAEDRSLSGKLANAFLRVCHWLGITGTVREEDSVGIHRQYVLGRGLRGDNRNAAILLREHTQNILLDAVIVGDNMQAGAWLDHPSFVAAQRIGFVILPLVTNLG